MGIIHLLSSDTVNRIAAGEVIERPASLVKELIENSLDSGADSITVDIQNGGISFIRVTDNGSGFMKDDIPTAFLRHATSKIREESDLSHIESLGFRGEALASIAGVSKVELITKRKEDFLGSRYLINGGEEIEFSEIGCPDGTTFMVRDLFYNVPARRKFLKSAVTEAGYINECINRFAVQRPDVSFSFMSQGRTLLHTSGNGNRKDAVYAVFGRMIADNLIPVSYEGKTVSITGFLGKSAINRGNRNYEMIYVNGRQIRSGILYNAVEDAYANYLMQHRYPFTVLLFEINPEEVDVNIHPAKMDVRISEQETITAEITSALAEILRKAVLIPDMEPAEEVKAAPVRPPEAFETVRIRQEAAYHAPAFTSSVQEAKVPELRSESVSQGITPVENDTVPVFSRPAEAAVSAPDSTVCAESFSMPVEESDTKHEQASFLDTDFQKMRDEVSFRIVGQVFKTYWIIETNDQMYIIDQHAAHEKINYERFVKAMNEQTPASQTLFPGIVFSLSIREEEILQRYSESLERIGFTIEHFGGRDYRITAVPVCLYRIDARDYFLSVLDSLSESGTSVRPEQVYETLASMSCKAAIKGNQRISEMEAEHLFKELLTLENPFHCPHGRPVIISMSQTEMERKFKRIL
ncbi:MAG: DNA mismatch repair endonuclease MutL [Lachnospiraceae bacterium]|nr:DNA mismatch repair endonuclease MutL [Lachnospiraceae bacterium]